MSTSSDRDSTVTTSSQDMNSISSGDREPQQKKGRTNDGEGREHAFLRSHPVVSALIGITHTLLCSGTVIGWASLLPVLRSEGVLDLSAAGYNQIFMAGAVVGNNLCNLPFGYILDRFGPKTCGIVASLLFATGLVLCSLGTSEHTGGSGLLLCIGYGLLGFTGPAIQIPTLHLAKLFHRPSGEGGGGGAGYYMSAQAAAFDGGTAVFALFAYGSQKLQWKSSTFFLWYLLVPAYTLCVAILIWPNTILGDADAISDSGKQEEAVPFPGKFGAVRMNSMDSINSCMGPGSPRLTADLVRRDSHNSVSHPSLAVDIGLDMPEPQQPSRRPRTSYLYDAPLRKVICHPSFYALGMFVSVLVLKLNFVIGTINDQLLYVFTHPSSEWNAHFEGDALSRVHTLINVFGAMLPFGFVLMPLTGFMLEYEPLRAFQLATTMGVIYAAVLTFVPQSTILLVFVAFPLVACSRQMVYSTIFHEVGAMFGFVNYGLLLGLVKIIVSLVSMIQYPLVEWAETVGGTNAYFGPNLVLLLGTVPLYLVVHWARLDEEPLSPSKTTIVNDVHATNGCDYDGAKEDVVRYAIVDEKRKLVTTSAAYGSTTDGNGVGGRNGI